MAIQSNLLKRSSNLIRSSSWLGLVCFLLCGTVLAFPPAPHHTFYGMVRNQWGDPINVDNALVTMTTGNQTGLRATISASTQPGLNYLMQVPMDSGLTSDVYQSTAFLQGASFQMIIRINNIQYIPIEMTLGSSQIGEPGNSTRLDLTLGVDSDGDGLPDAWEKSILAQLGGDLTDLDPNGDSDGDGMSNLQEFLAGTLAFDPSDGIRLKMSLFQGLPRMEFLTIPGRTYTIQASADMKQWNSVPFHAVVNNTVGPVLMNYPAEQVDVLTIEVPPTPGTEGYRYFRAQVQ